MLMSKLGVALLAVVWVVLLVTLFNMAGCSPSTPC